MNASDGAGRGIDGDAGGEAADRRQEGPVPPRPRPGWPAGAAHVPFEERSFEETLTEWAAAAREDEAVAGRLRAERQRMLEADEATLAEWALSLASQEAAAAVETASGRTRRGRVVAVGADFVALDDERASAGAMRTLIALDAVAAIRVLQDARGRSLSRPLRPEPATVADILSRMAGERRLVTLVVRGLGAVCGELSSVGRDILVVQPEGASTATTVVQLRLIEEVSLFGSG